MAAAIGIPDPVKGEAIALYVVAAPGVDPGEELTARVTSSVTDRLGKSFRPALVQWVGDLPRTRSAKIMRRVVKAVALGSDVGDLSSLENPESLEGIAPLA
jgi:acetyl-CoA synthetase